MPTRLLFYKDFRWEILRKITIYFFTFQDTMTAQDTQIALLKQSMEFIQNELHEVKEFQKKEALETKQQNDKILQMIANLSDTIRREYSTKQETKEVSERVDTLEKTEKSILVESVKYIILFIAWLFCTYILTKLWLK